MYIPIFINKFRLVGLLDSGGDICIISKSEINKLGFTNVPPPRETFDITSFSENRISVLGMINCLIKLHQGHKGISLDIHIVKWYSNVPTSVVKQYLVYGRSRYFRIPRKTPSISWTDYFTVSEQFKPTAFYKQNFIK